MAKFYMPMEKSMKGNGRTTSSVELGFSCTRTAQSMRESGNTTTDKELAKKHGQTVQYIVGSFKMGRKKDMENCYLQIRQYMKENSRIMRLMGKEVINGQMENCTLETG
jgi:hypothetical protein